MSIEYFYEKYEIFVKILRYGLIVIILQMVKLKLKILKQFMGCSDTKLIFAISVNIKPEC